MGTKLGRVDPSRRCSLGFWPKWDKARYREGAPFEGECRFVGIGRLGEAFCTFIGCAGTR